MRDKAKPPKADLKGKTWGYQLHLPLRLDVEEIKGTKVDILANVRKREEDILQKPFQKDRYSQVAHRTFHANEVDRYAAINPIWAHVQYHKQLLNNMFLKNVWRQKKKKKGISF